jgi:hypothetical protein
MSSDREIPSDFAVKSARASSCRSTLTEITVAPDPRRGRPGFARARSQLACAAADGFPKDSITSSRSNSLTVCPEGFRAVRVVRAGFIG